MKNDLCPCCSSQPYKDCCLKYHQGSFAENALKLMRSRYSAYALNLVDYIMKTTHPKNPSFELNSKNWEKKILQFSQNTTFEKLEIVDFTDGEQEAFVTFTAHLKQGNRDATFTEKSRFEKIGKQWLYLDGKTFTGKPVSAIT